MQGVDWKTTGIIPSAARDCSTYQFRAAELSELEFQQHMIELLFLLGFTLHNLEEALWLPQWSKHARKYRKEVSEN